MAFNEIIAERIRGLLIGQPDFLEKKMFGGIAFMLNGKMCCGVINDNLMVRVPKEKYDDILELPYVKPMDFTGRPLTGMIYVEPKGFRLDKNLQKWLDLGIEVVSSPSKTNLKLSDEEEFNGFPKDTFLYLKKLRLNNDREWFNKHKDDYEKAYLEPGLSFIESIAPAMKKISSSLHCEPAINGSLFRLQRDVRFALDKTPYKDYMDMLFWQGDKKSMQSLSFFLRLTEKDLIIGAGILSFDPAMAHLYADAVVDDKTGKKLELILKKIKQSGIFEIGGGGRKKVPKGYDAEHSRANLLLHNGLYAEYRTKLPDSVYKKDFIKWCIDHYKTVLPLYNWLLTLKL